MPITEERIHTNSLDGVTDRDTGIRWLQSGNAMVFSAGGTERARLSTSAMTLTGITLVGATALAVGASTAAATAIVDLTSTTQGFLPPRMTSTQRDNISTPATGLTIYNTTSDKLNVYTGSAWEAVTSA